MAVIAPRFLALSLLCLIGHGASAQVYKCVGADGKVGFSDKPCLTDEQSSTVKLRKSAPRPIAPSGGADGAPQVGAGTARGTGADGAPKTGVDTTELAPGWTPGAIESFIDLCATTHLARAMPEIDAAARAKGKAVDHGNVRDQFLQACGCASRTVTARFDHASYQADQSRIVNDVTGTLIRSGQCPVPIAGAVPPPAATQPPPAAAPAASNSQPAKPKIQHGDDAAEQSSD